MNITPGLRFIDQVEQVLSSNNPHFPHLFCAGQTKQAHLRYPWTLVTSDGHLQLFF